MVDIRIISILKSRDVLNVYRPRLESKVVHEMLHNQLDENHPGRELFSKDLAELERYYELGTWYNLFVMRHWFNTLTTRQFVELMCWSYEEQGGHLGQINEILGVPSYKLVGFMAHRICDVRFASIDKLAAKYSGESGLFTGDYRSYFEKTVKYIMSQENVILIQGLYLILASASSSTWVEKIKQGVPWLTKLPEHINTWGDSLDPLDNPTLKEIIASEEG